MNAKTKEKAEAAEMNAPGTEVATPAQDLSVNQMLMEAVRDPEFDANKLELMISLKERVDATEAKNAFQDAMFRFHENPPRIVKEAPVFGKNKDDGPQYYYAKFEKTVAQVRPALRAVGITATWSSEPLENGITKVTCMLRHTLGHEERSSMAGAPETGGSKNSIQGVGSSDSYLRKYTYLSVIGLVAEGEDTDGNVEPETISNEQLTELQDLGDKTMSDIPKLCKSFGIVALYELPANQYFRVVGMMHEKAKREAKNADV